MQAAAYALLFAATAVPWILGFGLKYIYIYIYKV